MQKMKQYLLASTMCVLPFAASAADMAVKSPYTPQPVPFTWTGFYVGASAGLISQNTTGTDLGDGSSGTSNGMLFSAGDTYGVAGTGGLFGLNAGYNYQTGAWVFGLEADIALSTVKNAYYFDPSPPDYVSSQLNSLGTVRGRIGYAFDRALLYATGGLAYGNVKNGASDGDPDLTVSTSGWRTGWTGGAGLEYAVTNHWTVRAEWLYVDLGTSTGTSPLSGCRFGFKNTYNVGRLGVNYKY
jgi:outer membrane immunogenic protein